MKNPETEITNLKSIINDLTLTVELCLSNYPFDEDHKEKIKNYLKYIHEEILENSFEKILKDIYGENIPPDIKNFVENQNTLETRK